MMRITVLLILEIVQKGKHKTNEVFHVGIYTY
jgi:hypothetical protein